jgi:hypothetical protein
MTAVKFLFLVILLNIIRYAYAYLPIEQLAFMPMFSVMAQHPSYFNTDFTTVDWVTSYLYNFMMWLVFTWVFMLLHPRLKGHLVIRALKVYGLMLLIFASISAIYMNHYSHPKVFYLYSIFDALLVFPMMAVATGLLYPVFFKPGNNEGE